MSAKPSEMLDVRSRQEWRKWLKEHYDSKSEIWLVFHKRHTGITCISYNGAVEEALCFGWIDSIVRRLARLYRAYFATQHPYRESVTNPV